MTLLSETTPVARKNYSCDASVWVCNYGWNGMGLSFSELRSIARARHNKWRIIKGDKYVRQGNIQDGEFRTFKAIPEIHEICLKHNYYQD